MWLLLHLRRNTRAWTTVANVRNRRHLPMVDLLVLSICPLLDRVRSRLRPVAFRRERHRASEIVHLHAAAEQRRSNLRAVSRTGLFDRCHHCVRQCVAGKRIVVTERRVVRRLELPRDRTDQRCLRARAVGRQAGKPLRIEVRHVPGHTLDEHAIDRRIRGDRDVDASSPDRLDQLRAVRLPRAVEDRIAALDLASQAGDLRAEIESRRTGEGVLAAHFPPSCSQRALK